MGTALLNDSMGNSTKNGDSSAIQLSAIFLRARDKFPINLRDGNAIAVGSMGGKGRIEPLSRLRPGRKSKVLRKPFELRQLPHKAALNVGEIFS